MAADPMTADQVRAAVAAAPPGKVDLSGRDMSHADLTGLDLSGANAGRREFVGGQHAWGQAGRN